MESMHDAMAPESPRPPKVLLVGDSWISGLGVGGESFGTIAAADLGADEVLDISAVGKTVGDTLGDAERIRDFAPDLAILFSGGTDSLVLPGPSLQRLIERFGPPSWQGLAGLEPRARFSQDPVKRRQQLRSSAIKKVVKRWALKVDGRRRVPLEQYERNLEALLVLLAGVGCANVFVSMFNADPSMFPGTPKAMDATQVVLTETLQGRPRTVQVDVHDVLRYWDDFLDDNLHLNEQGHRRVADYVIPASEMLLAERAAERSRTVLG